jgi:hypothetical protein
VATLRLRPRLLNLLAVGGSGLLLAVIGLYLWLENFAPRYAGF